MPIELDIFNKQVLANKGAYNTVNVLVSGDVDAVDLSNYLTTSEINSLSSSLITKTEINSLTGLLVESTSTLETPTTGISAINNIVTLSQSTYNALTVKLPTTLYVIV